MAGSTESHSKESWNQAHVPGRIGAAEALRSAKEEVLTLWTGQVRKRVVGAASYGQVALADAVPRLLDELVCALELENIEGLEVVVGKEHGEQRAGFGTYSLEQLVAEFELLQQTLLELLEGRCELSFNDRTVIRAFIFAGVKASVFAFSGKQNAVIQEQKALLEAVIQSMGEGLIVVNASGDVLFYNPAMERLQGALEAKSAPETWPSFYGLHLPDKVTLFPPKELPVVKALRGEVSDDVEIFVQSERVPAGRWQCVNARPIRDKSERILGAVVVIADLTKRKRAEEALTSALEELSRSNTELERFAAVASHDLKEPLRMVFTYLLLLSKRYKGKLGKDADEFIAFAVDGAKRMTALINALLNYSKIARERHAFEIVQTSQLVGDCLSSLQLLVEENKAEVVVAELPDVMGDPGLLSLLFQNLIENALKYRSERSPRIEITVEDKGEEWLFRVSDNGIGMGTENLRRVFDPFVRSCEEKNYPGYGIGLAVCKRAVEIHHGRIWVESKPGAGSTFFFTLPKIANHG